MVLGAIAARTARIRLGSAVTVLSSDDPVRVFQRYSTLNAISDGRAEVILGRGSSIDSFPLFGYDLADYEELFEEKTNLFAELLKGGPVTWEGKTRAALTTRSRAAHRVRAVPDLDRRRRQPAVGHPRRALRVLADARDHRRLTGPVRAVLRALPPGAGAASDDEPLPIGVHSPGHVAATDEQAREEFWPRYLEVIRTSARPAASPIPTKESFLHEIGPHGALYVGSPETVAQKIAANLTDLGANRFDLKYGMGGLSHEALMTNIELYGTQVVPRVRELLAPAPAAAGSIL